MKLTKELKELISKWRKILKLEDWDLDIQLECPKKYREIKKVLGFEPGMTRGLASTTEERQHSLIYLSNESKDNLEEYLVHELNHTILNETDDFIACLIEFVDNEEVKSVLKVRQKDICEKLVWKLTRIVLELNKR